MKIKLEEKEFELAPEVMTTMLEMMQETKADKHERGFLMCNEGGTVTTGKKCKGNSCAIMLTDCAGKPVTGSFHTHPQVISYSLSDYLSAIHNAKTTLGHDYLMCVSLLDKGIRCKALKQIPPPGVVPPPGTPDTDENREKVKPYFTKKVNIGLMQMAALLADVHWEDLPPEAAVIAIDEGDDTCAPTGKECVGEGGAAEKKPWELGAPEPSGVYPWSQKQQFKSEKQDGGIAMVPIAQAEILTPETQFINSSDIEYTDPTLIHAGEVMQYVNAIVPVQLLQEKNDKGQFIVHDGRHRLAAWRAAGYKVVPVVWVLPGEE